MKRITFASLRVRLILIVLLAVIPALGLTLYTGLEHRQIAANQAKEEALRMARHVSTSHGQIIEATRQLLYTLAQIPQVGNLEPAACSSLFAVLLKQNPYYLNIGAAYANGNVFASAIPFTRPINVTDRPYFRRAIQTRNFAIGDYQIGLIHGKPSVNFGYPILNDAGRVRAVVFASLDLNWINRLASESQLPKRATLLVTDKNGMILARYPEPEKWVGKSMPEVSIVKAILTKGEGLEEALGLDGVPQHDILFVFRLFTISSYFGIE